MSPNSVTFCIYDRAGACGGPFAWAVDFVRFLHQRGRAVRLLVLCPGGRATSVIADASERAGIPVSVLDTHQAVYLEDQVEWILRMWKGHPSSVFIANLVLPALYACRWIRHAGGRTVGVVHSNPDHDPFYADVLRHFVSGSPEWVLDAVVPVSDFIALKVHALAPSAMEIVTIPCGTSLPEKGATPPVNTLRLLYCGRLVQEAKRIRELTEAFLKAAEMHGVTATICGEGEERSWLTQRLAGQDKVLYVGNLPPEKVQALMTEHHVVVLLSDYEGLSMALVEGMACGLVPVCLDEPSGAREVIRHEINGFLVDDRGPSFLKAIDRLRDPALWIRLSAQARETVETRYAHPVVFHKWTDLMDRLATGLDSGSNRVPNRIHLHKVRTQGAFSGYPPNRPTRREQLRQRLDSLWQGIRTTIRPRSRIRAIFGKRTQNYD